MDTAFLTPVIMTGQAMQIAGQDANRAAAQATFAIYQERRPENTRRSQRAALRVYSEYLRSVGIGTGDLYSDPKAWHGMTWGLVQGFQLWMIQQGYSMKTINDRISVVKVYMSLANSADVIPDADIIRLQSLRGYTRKESIDADRNRSKAGTPTRRGAKKQAGAVVLTEEQARALKSQPDTPQGRRDALMMTLLLEHGLRVSEIAILAVDCVDPKSKRLTFYRPKTGTISRHVLRGRAWRIMSDYLERDRRDQSGALFVASRKSGMLKPDTAMSIRAINDRVKALGQAVGIDNLSPHDCRHYGATKAGNDPRVSLAALMAWGGWSSPQSAARYIDRGQADNEGVSIGDD
jgi:integrase